MLSKVKSCALVGVDGYIVEVETDISNGLILCDIVGLGDMAVREARERVRSAIKNSGLEFPLRRITINLAPANQRKEGSSFDLAIALGILAASGQVKDDDINQYMFVGELSLDGYIKPIKGALPIAISAYENGISHLILPAENANEAAVVDKVDVLPATTIMEVIKHINGEQVIKPCTVNLDDLFNISQVYSVDFSDVKGQENVKRALEVAAAGAHNCIMIGSPGCGKTMIAKRLHTILPPLTFDEALETTKIHSIAGILPPKTSLITARPFRAPHHTMSDVSLIGGGRYPKPGEISLAHYGVLFLDELPEFSKDALEVLRQPLEDEKVTISRVNSTLTYPAKTTLICAANPCKCGNYLDANRECSCTLKQVKQYLGRISRPLLDRFDIHIEVSAVNYKELESSQIGEKSEVIRQRVIKCRRTQLERYKGSRIYSNSQLTPNMITKYCKLENDCKALLRSAFEKLGLSARAYSRILKVARTIADMEESESIQRYHLAEAIQYRSLDRKIWDL